MATISLGGGVRVAYPSASSAGASAVMRANRRESFVEIEARRALHARGLRYRVGLRIGSGRSAPRPDVVFTRAKVAIFIDGCFWHGCPEHGTVPKANSEYWSAKIRRNRERDQENTRALTEAGWLVLRFWEHEPLKNVVDRIDEVVRARRAG